MRVMWFELFSLRVQLEADGRENVVLDIEPATSTLKYTVFNVQQCYVAFPNTANVSRLRVTNDIWYAWDQHNLACDRLAS